MRYLIFALGLLCLATPLHAAPDGARLFKQNCAVCHGEDGRGGVGVPLALPSFLANVSDDYLAKTIRHGRPGRVMPAFEKLSDAQVKAIVDYVRGFSKAPAPTFDVKPVKGDPKHGASLYKSHCASCHGESGQGGHGTGVTLSRPRDLPIIAPALNNPGFLASTTDMMIKKTLMDGREGTPMISFIGAGLSETDINDIVSFVRAFENQHRPEEDEGDIAPALIYESPYDLEQTLKNLRQAVISENFRIVREQYLENGLLPEDKQNHKQVVLYFCNFNFLNEALAIDPRVGLFLPCRVTVVEHKGKVMVMSINPLRLSKLFNNNELDEACKRMHGVYRNILEDATL